MVICIIAEGSYPYITGGVSAWIHQLISSLPMIDFKILSIMPDYQMVDEKRYPPLENLIKIETIYLNDFAKYRTNKKQYKLKGLDFAQKEILRSLITFDDTVDLKNVINILTDKKNLKQPSYFLKSDIFWEQLKEIYKKKYSENRFNEFFWTYRGIFISLIHMIDLKPIPADIYHSVSTGYAGFVGAILRQKTDKPYMITEHGIYPREREEEILKASWVPSQYKRLWIDYFYYLSRVSYNYSSQIVTLFNRNREFQENIGADPEKTTVIPNGVDLKKYKFHKRNFKKEKGNYIVGAVLRVTPIKDVMTLIRAFKSVHQNLRNVTLDIIGPTDEDEDYFDQCKSLVRLLRLESVITFTGRANVMEYYQQMDCLVLTSISEGQPLVLLEAMAVGIPIVSTNVGSCKELIMPDSIERCGIITPLVNPSATAKAIMDILSSPQESELMALNGRRRVEKYYSKEDFIGKYKDIYLDLGG